VAELRERVVESKVLHRGKFVEFRIETIERADGSRAVRDWAGHPGAVAIVALDADGRVALVRQWRLAANDALLEIPAGGLDTVDGAKEDPEIASRRELEEETGLRAGTWRKLGEFYSAPGFTDELMHLYLATDLSPADPGGRLGPDEDERLILEWLPWRDAVAAVERGDIRDAKSVAGLFWLARVLDEGEVDEEATVGEVARATYRLTQREAILATVQMTRRSNFTRVMGIVISAISLFGIVSFGDPVSVALLVLGLSMVTGWFAAPFVWYQARRRPDLVTAEWHLIADESGLHITSVLMNGLQRWTTFRVAHETQQFVFLDTAAGQSLVFPKRAFSPGDLATFYRLLDRNGLLKG
jgi:ADP-ribose pyrophosphatase